MSFISLEYLLFLPLVCSLYFILQARHRWILLLAASYGFYMYWRPEFAILLLFSTVVDYWAAIKMEQCETSAPHRKKLFLLLSLSSNLGLLFGFKYFSFINNNLQQLFSFWEWTYPIPAFNILLPVGISFYTFQTLSYTIDVYWQKRKPEKHFGIFALYVSFFPQLVAGPIERSTTLLPQLRQQQHLDWARVIIGAKLVVWGAFKKMVIGDNLVTLVEPVFANPQAYDGFTLLVANFAFMWQLYCDFSGYTDMAIGSAYILGINLMPNFALPYTAISIRDYWQRWHMSLTAWLHSYVYIPLGGSRVSLARKHINVFVLLMLCGIWHGAGWNYISFGFLQSFFIITDMMTYEARQKKWQQIGLTQHPKLHHFLRVAFTFVLLFISYVVFRSNHIFDAWYILSHVSLEGFTLNFNNQGINFHQLHWAVISVATIFVLYIEYGQPQINQNKNIFAIIPNVFIRWTCYYAMILSILFFSNLSKSTNDLPFFYFQF